MVGTQFRCGNRRPDNGRLRRRLAAADRTKGGPTALPPQGLCFWQVDYGTRDE